jgi:hypothetical protein
MSVDDIAWTQYLQMVDELGFVVKTWRERGHSEVAISQAIESVRFRLEAEALNVDQSRYCFSPRAIN